MKTTNKRGIKKNEWRRLFSNLMLWIVSILLKWIVAAISILVNLVYYIITLRKAGPGKLADYFFNRALSNDQHGNACYPKTFQIMTSKKGGEKFGNPDDTISYVIAKNEYKLKTNFGGRLIGGILNAIDPGHLYKAIESKMESDQEAMVRIQEDKYYE